MNTIPALKAAMTRFFRDQSDAVEGRQSDEKNVTVALCGLSTSVLTEIAAGTFDVAALAQVCLVARGETAPGIGNSLEAVTDYIARAERG